MRERRESEAVENTEKEKKEIEKKSERERVFEEYLSLILRLKGF